MSASEIGLPRISPFVLAFFRRIVRSYFKRHFRAVQVQGSEHLANVSEGPLIVYGNHVSWWDPMLITLVGHMLMPHRRHYAPMLAEPLKRYAILRKIGIFPVEIGSRRGAVEFAQTAGAILSSGGVLWITPQARFADVREFPLRFKAGLALLIARMPEIKLLPLAVEYTFWDERSPEALARFGEVFQLEESRDIGAINEQLESKLAALMLDLQRDSLTRDPSLFSSVLSGRRGTGGVYGIIQRFRKGFHPDHTKRPSV